MSNNILQNFFSQLYIPRIGFTDIIEIAIISIILYYVFLWIKNTKAWMLVKGIVIVILFAGIAYILNLKTILWIAGKTISVGIIALVIIFQPELRRALEQLGRQKIVISLFKIGSNVKKDRILSDATINGIVRASYVMGQARTGALIVIEQSMLLDEYIKTGIKLDAVCSAELLINTFEHNTPLHDGAVIVRDNRIVAATCYLPISENNDISKALGTRHRAALGVSEMNDSFTIVVSEETGRVSVCQDGKITENLAEEELRECLENLTKDNISIKGIKDRFTGSKETEVDDGKDLS